MALILLGPMVADARGSIGGVVFARNSAGNYARNRTKPVYPSSPKQNERTALMSTLVAHWQGTLTNAQRSEWNDAAGMTKFRNRLGQGFHPSGFNLYTQCNFLLDLSGQAMVTTAPDNTMTPAIPATIVYTEGIGCRVTAIDSFDTGCGGAFIMQRAANMPSSRSFFTSPWTYLGNSPVATLDGLPWTYQGEGDTDQGKRNWVRFKMVLATGASSAWSKYYVDRAPA